jgi:threonine dehydrogenase-like Zn-dependent dehydrogenase
VFSPECTITVQAENFIPEDDKEDDSMKTEALWMVGERKAELGEFDARDPKAGEIRFETKACGICSWDALLYKGMAMIGIDGYPFTFGHEAVGIVTDIGEGVTDVQVGDKVFTAMGDNDKMARHVTIASSAVGVLPKEVDDYAPWVLEPMACCVNLIHKADIQPGDDVVLVGAGYMGGITLQGLVNTTPAGSITVFDVDESQLEYAKSYHAVQAYSPLTDEGKKAAETIQAKGGAQVVIDFTGAPSGFELSKSLCAKEAGKLVLGSWFKQDLSFTPFDWHVSGLTVLNCSMGCNPHYPEIVKACPSLVVRGSYDPAALITHTAPVSEANEILTIAADRKDGYLKGVILF